MQQNEKQPETSNLWISPPKQFVHFGEFLSRFRFVLKPLGTKSLPYSHILETPCPGSRGQELNFKECCTPATTSPLPNPTLGPSAGRPCLETAKPSPARASFFLPLLTQFLPSDSVPTGGSRGPSSARQGWGRKFRLWVQSPPRAWTPPLHS